MNLYKIWLNKESQFVHHHLSPFLNHIYAEGASFWDRHRIWSSKMQCFWELFVQKQSIVLTSHDVPRLLCLAAAGCPMQDTLEESRASVKNSFWRSTASPTNTGAGEGRTTTSTTGQWKDALHNWSDSKGNGDIIWDFPWGKWGPNSVLGLENSICLPL